MSTAREHRIEVVRSARYYTLGSGDASAKELWFVLHGYGQLAAQFIRVFEALDDGTRFIVAPEALNRFYLATVDTTPATERPVGATWMTREDREQEIADYLAYLDRVAASVRPRVPNARVTVLGFSQGTATAARWIEQGGIRPICTIVWGGFLPPELDLSEGQPLRRSQLFIVLGQQDRFASTERVAEEERRLRAAGMSYELIRYPGGHGIVRDQLSELSRRLLPDA
jgi:predicted esterase